MFVNCCKFKLSTVKVATWRKKARATSAPTGAQMMIDWRCSAWGWFWRVDSRGGGDDRTSDFRLNGQKQFKCHRKANKNQTLFFLAVSVLWDRFGISDWHNRQTEKRVCNADGSLKKKAENNCATCEFVSPPTTSWINGHACRRTYLRLLSSVPPPLMSPSSENRRGWFTCACATQSEQRGPLFTAPPMQKEKEKRACAETFVSHTFLCRRPSQRLLSPPPILQT